MKIVIAGKIITGIKSEPAYKNWQQVSRTTLLPMNLQQLTANIILLGELEQDDLNAVILQSHAIILPITQTSGTNLKTAEALLSQKMIVGTHAAFDGYEEYLSDTGVYLADDPGDFQKTMLMVWRYQTQQCVRKNRDALTWDSALKPFFQAVKQ